MGEVAKHLYSKGQLVYSEVTLTSTCHQGSHPLPMHLSHHTTSFMTCPPGDHSRDCPTHHEALHSLLPHSQGSSGHY